MAWVVLCATRHAAGAETSPRALERLDYGGRAPEAVGSLAGSSSTTLGLELAYADRGADGGAFGAGLWLGLPTDAWLTAPRAGRAFGGASADDDELGPIRLAALAPARAVTPTAGRVPAGGSTGPTAGSTSAAPAASPLDVTPCEEPEGSAPAPHRTEPGLGVPRIAPGDAREAVAAAVRAAGLGPASSRLDDLASRARWSAALPELRLRVTRLVDQSESLAPTEYDEDRTTASDGSSLWFEARGTWRLDRGIFAEEEIRIEQLRRAHAEERRRASERALALLLEWQSAMAELRDPARPREQCESARLRVEQAATALDVMTDGWFERWARRSPARRVGSECSAP